MVMDAFTVVGGLVAIFSNLWFLWPAAYSRKVDENDRAYLYYCIALFTSPLYHLCLGFPRACIFGARSHYFIDFSSANLAIPLTALYFPRFRHQYVERWIILTAFIAMLLLVTQVGSSFAAQCIIAGVSLAFVAVYLIWHKLVYKELPRYNMTNLALGVLFTMLSIAFYTVQDAWPAGYGYTHGFWHMFGAIGQRMFLGIHHRRAIKLERLRIEAEQRLVLTDTGTAFHNKETIFL